MYDSKRTELKLRQVNKDLEFRVLNQYVQNTIFNRIDQIL